MAITLLDESTILVPATVSERCPGVLVFDSGVGGLSVYNEIRQLLPDLHYLYVFDNAAFPYGEKEEAFIIERVVNVVEAVARQHAIALVIIACNTASTVSLPALRNRFTFPIVGVVPAIKPAACLTRNGVIGLLATSATIRRDYTHELVAQFACECRIEMIGSAALVDLAEAKLHGDKPEIGDIQRILQPWVMLAEPPDTIILGCTHFPLLKEELLQVLPQGTQLVDSGAAIARRTVWLLEHEMWKMSSSQPNTAYCTAFTPMAMQLMPVLQRYGFAELKELNLKW